MLTLAGFWTGVLAFVFAMVAVLMVLVILIQRPKGGGLAGAFGGAGGSTQAFGAKTGDFLTIVTVGLFLLFLLLGIALVYATRGQGTELATEPPMDAGDVPAAPLDPDVDATDGTSLPAGANIPPTGTIPDTEPEADAEETTAATPDVDVEAPTPTDQPTEPSP